MPAGLRAALHVQAARALADADAAPGRVAAFANLPSDTVAVNADGVYLTVSSGIGVLAGMESPQFFSRDGAPLGQITLIGIRDTGD